MHNDVITITIAITSPPLVSFMTKKNVYRYTEIKPKRLRVAGNWNFNYLLVSNFD